MSRCSDSSRLSSLTAHVWAKGTTKEGGASERGPGKSAIKTHKIPNLYKTQICRVYNKKKKLMHDYHLFTALSFVLYNLYHMYIVYCVDGSKVPVAVYKSKTAVHSLTAMMPFLGLQKTHSRLHLIDHSRFACKSLNAIISNYNMVNRATPIYL